MDPMEHLPNRVRQPLHVGVADPAPGPVNTAMRIATLIARRGARPYFRCSCLVTSSASCSTLPSPGSSSPRSFSPSPPSPKTARSTPLSVMTAASTQASARPLVTMGVPSPSSPMERSSWPAGPGRASLPSAWFSLASTPRARSTRPSVTAATCSSTSSTGSCPMPSSFSPTAKSSSRGRPSLPPSLAMGSPSTASPPTVHPTPRSVATAAS